MYMYPQSNSARSVRDLSGVWDFRFNANEPWQPIAVPASYNDQSPDPEFRRHYGMAYYRTTFTVPEGARRVLRFDAVTHNAVLRAMIERDKNHPCVVLWSLGNEPDTEHFPESARDYWRPLYEQAHAQDPQDRPVTMVCCQNDYTKDITTRTMDVVCINRYYGWYNLSGDLDNAAYAFKKELDFWETIDKPLILSEYGADTVAGMHGFAPEMFTEEFQVEYYRTINGCLDERRFVVGEWPWNFADFSTQQGPMRVGSCNRKGLFTRERTPKLAAHYFRDRWGKKEPNDR